MRVDPDTNFESELWDKGIQYIAGLDEAGRGALAGPVCVGAVILPNDKSLLASTLAGARDSKQMTPRTRERLAIQIKDVALAWAVGFATPEEIDMQGIVRAIRLAAIRALHQFTVTPQYLLTDFRLELPQLDISQTSLVKGDARCLSIAWASILAKTGLLSTLSLSTFACTPAAVMLVMIGVFGARLGVWAGRKWVVRILEAVKGRCRGKKDRQLRPNSPRDCPQCATMEACEHEEDARRGTGIWGAQKARQGRKKQVSSQGYCCLNGKCLYFGETDENRHGLVSDGWRGKRERIRQWRCEACGSRFSSRRQTAMYWLKTPSSRVTFLPAVQCDHLRLPEILHSQRHRRKEIVSFPRYKNQHLRWLFLYHHHSCRNGGFPRFR